ncbi:hypothetical protein [Rubrobacter xylanophilus]|nr:hypothetical protein [Rubrobacter xylanophilus]
MPVAYSFDALEKEVKLKEHLAICDLSALPRFGVKGPNASEWLASNGINVPETVNTWTNLPEDKGLILRLGMGEYLIEYALSHEEPNELRDSLSRGVSSVYEVNRQDAVFVLIGREAKKSMLQVCNIDFDSINYGIRPVLLTQVAAVPVLILPERLEGHIYSFRIWCSYAYGLYLWEELNAIVKELNGGVIGISTLFERS